MTRKIDLFLKSIPNRVCGTLARLNRAAVVLFAMVIGGTAYAAPTVVSQPQLVQVVTLGSPVSLSVAATGASPLAYQWRMAGTAIPGASGATLTLSNVQLSNAAAYDVVVTDSTGSVTSDAARLYVRQIGSRYRLTSAQPETADLAAVAIAEYGTGAVLADWDEIVASFGGNMATLYAQLGLGDKLEAMVQKGGQRIYSSPRQYYIQRSDSGLPFAGFQAHATSGTLYLGSWYGLRLPAVVKVAGTVVTDDFSGDLSKWVKMADDGGSNWAISSGTLIGSYPPGKGGTGNTQSFFLLTDPNQPGTDWSASADFTWVKDVTDPTWACMMLSFGIWSSGTAKLDITLSGSSATESTPTPRTKVYGGWQYWNGSWNSGGGKETTVNWDPGTWHRGTLEKRGKEYRLYFDGVQVFQLTDNFLNGAGKVGFHVYTTQKLDNFELSPIGAGVLPTILTPPVAQTVTAGGRAILAVTPAGTAPFTYQWRKGGVAIAGATNSSLAFASAGTTDAGSYDVVVTNPAGSITSAAAPLTVTADPTLVALYRFDGDTSDASGTGNNGTIVGGVTYSSGVSGQAATFDGTTGYIDIPHSSSLNLTTGMTIAFWVNQGSTPSASWRWVDKVTASTSNGWWYACYASGGLANMPSLASATSGINSTVSVPSNQWTHVAVTFNNGQLTHYVGGALAGTGTIASTLVTNTLSVRIGDAHVLNAVDRVPFKGMIDDLRIYNRALSATEIVQLGTLVTIAPSIITQPQTQKITLGQTGTLTAVAMGTAPFSYQWRKNGAAITGATGATYTITSAQIDHAGTYDVVVSNAAGAATSQGAALAVGAFNDTSYVFSTLAGLAGTTGTADGTGSAARFNSPARMAVDGAGNVYVADGGNHTIRKITPAGVVSVFAGSPGLLGSTDGTGTAARFNFPVGLVFDALGNLFVTDTQNYTVRKITPAGVVTTFAGVVGARGVVNGTGTAAKFDYPSGIGIDRAGNLYVTEIYQNQIRKITPAGVVTTFVSAVGLNIPYEVAVDSAGNVFVADGYNHVIRKITPAGAVSTFAGTVGSSGSADGTGSAARFLYPNAVGVDAADNVYVADSNNCTVRKITPAGVVTTIGGLAGARASADGAGSTARFIIPLGVAVDLVGNVYVADGNISGTIGNTIRKGTPASLAPQAPSIATAPASQTVNAGGGATFSVVPAGTAPFAYQWRRNAAAISGATNSALSLTNVFASQAGSYDVVITNSVGSVTSAAVALTVTAPTIVAITDAFDTLDTTNRWEIVNGTWSVAGGQLTGYWNPSVSAPQGSLLLRGQDLTADYDATFTAVLGNGATRFRLYKDNSNEYSIDIAQTAVAVSRMVGGALFANLSTVTVSGVSGTTPSVAGIRRRGAVFTISINGQDVHSFTDDQWAGALRFGLGVYNTAVFDAFSFTSPPQILDVLNFTSGLPVGWQFTPDNHGNRDFANGRMNAYTTDAWHRISRPLTVPGAASSLTITYRGNTASGSWGGYNMVYLATTSGAVYQIAHGWGDTTGSTAGTQMDGSIYLTTNSSRLNRQVTPRTFEEFVYTITFRDGEIAYKGVPVNGTAASSTAFDFTAPIAGFTLASISQVDLVLYNTVLNPLWIDDVVIRASLAGSVAPAVATAPAAQVIPSGGGGTLSVVATGNPAPTYQWRKNGTAIAGATAATYAITAATTAAAGNYDVVVTNSVGSVTSAPAPVFVVPYAVGGSSAITYWDPISGGNGHYYLVVTFPYAATPVFDGTYNWVKADAVARATGGTLASVTSAAENTFVYNLVSGTAGGTLGVDPKTGPAIGALNLQTASDAGQVWSWMTGEPWSYQNWRAGEPNGGISGKYIHYHGTATWNDAGAGTDVSGAVIEWNSLPAGSVAPTILSQPVAATATFGTAATLAVTATGSPAPTYQWRKNGTAVAGATNSTLTLASAAMGDTGSYDVVVTNASGSVTSSARALTVQAALIGWWKFDGNVNDSGPNGLNGVNNGGTFMADRTGTANSAIRLRGRNVVAPPGSGPLFQAGDFVRVPKSPVMALGTEFSVAMWVRPLTGWVAGGPTGVMIMSQHRSTTNTAGTWGHSAQSSPDSFSFFGSPYADGVVNSGTPLVAGGWTHSCITYTGGNWRWYINGRMVSQGQRTYQEILSLEDLLFSSHFSASGQTAFYDGDIDDARMYKGALSDADVASLVGLSAAPTSPVILAQPQPTVTSVGTAATLAVTATGSGTLTYQWRKNGVAIASATNQTLVFASLATTDAGNYDVVVTNAAGTITSAAALLTVTIPPAVTISETFDTLDTTTRWEIVGGTWTVAGGNVTGFWSQSSAYSDQGNLLLRNQNLDADYDATFVAILSGSQAFALYSASGSKINVNFDSTAVSVERRINAAVGSPYTIIAGTTYAGGSATVPTTVKLSRRGAVFIVYVNSTKVLEFTDTQWGGRLRVGIKAYGTAVFDSFTYAPGIDTSVLFGDLVDFNSNQMPAGWQVNPSLNNGKGTFANGQMNAIAVDSQIFIYRPFSMPTGAAKLTVTYRGNTASGTWGGGSQMWVGTTTGASYQMSHGWGDHSGGTAAPNMEAAVFGGPSASVVYLGGQLMPKTYEEFAYTIVVQDGQITHRGVRTNGQVAFDYTVAIPGLLVANINRFDIGLVQTVIGPLWVDDLRTTVTTGGNSNVLSSETLTFNDNQLPAGWQVGPQANTGSYDFANGRMNANYSSMSNNNIYRNLVMPAGATRLEIKYRGNTGSGGLGAAHSVSVAFSSSPTINFGHGYGTWVAADQMLGFINNSASTTRNAERSMARVSDIYDYTVGVENGRVTYRGVRVSDSAVMFDLSADFPGLQVGTANQILVNVNNWGSSIPTWNDDFQITTYSSTAATTVAPAITTQPVAQAVNVGAGATLSVVATGTPAPTYQWRKGGVAISGATNSTYAIPAAATTDAGSYDVVITNSAGSVTSGAVAVAVRSLPTVTTSVVTNITNTGARLEGVVVSDGGATVTERGYVFSTSPNPTTANATKYTDGSGVGLFATIAPTYTAKTTYFYRAYATNVVGTAYGEQRVFTTDPTLVAYYRFEGDATDSSGTNNHGTANAGISFVPGTVGQAAKFNGTTGFIAVPDANSLDLTTAMSVAFWIKVDTANTTSSRRVFSKSASSTANGYGMNYYQFGAADPRMEVDLLVAGESGSPPIISYALDTWVHVAVVVSGGTQILYRNGVEVSRGPAVASLPVNTLSLVLGASDERDYLLQGSLDEFRLYNRALPASEIAGLVNVQAALVADNLDFNNGSIPAPWTLWPNNYGSRDFANGRMNAYATDATHRIYRDLAISTGTTKLELKYRGNTAASSIGCSNSVLLDLVGSPDQISLGHGYGASTASGQMNALAYWGATKLGEQLSPRTYETFDYTITIENGKITHRGVRTTGEVLFNYTATAASLRLVDITRIYLNLYTTVTANLWADDVQLTIYGDPTTAIAAPAITTQPVSQVVLVGQNVTFTAAATGNPGPTFQWLKSGVNIAGATGTSLVLTNVQTGDAGGYSVVVANSGGTVISNTATLTVNVPTVAPVITTQPQAQTVVAGTDVTICVTATGTPAPIYQWMRNGTSIAGATQSCLNISNPTVADAGNYSCLISNEAGSVISTTVALTITVPPVITTQPVAQTVTAGQAATFTVVATGMPAPIYQWRKGGVNVSGATNASLVIVSAQPGDVGSYDVVITNGAGSATSDLAALTVNVPPAITTQPGAQPILVGGSATFSVVATGTPAPTYQWRKNGANIVGATHASYTIASMQAADAGTYDVVVSNVAGSVTSIPFQLVVIAPPAITTQPLARTVVAGTSVSFSVAATGLPAPTYQWRKDAVAISGATAATYSIASAQTADAGTYDVVVANSVAAVTSSGAALVVNVPPAITTQPVAQTVVAGESAAFSVVATGTPAPTYQWRKNSTNLSGATNASYAVASAQSSDAGSYDVVVTNVAGAVTSNAVPLTVNVPPAITTQPVAQTVNAGAAGSFTVVATGTSPLSYQWRKGGLPISGATSATYSIVATQGSDAGSYDVTVTNVAGNVTSGAATLVVNVPPTITTQPQAQAVLAGANVSLTVVATGIPAPTYQWRKNGVAIGGATNSTLAITGAVTADAGNYDVVVTNVAGTVTSNVAALAVNVPPVITTQPQPQTVVAGANATFNVVASGTPAPTYQWLKNGASIAGATGASLTLNNAQTSDAGNYAVVVANVAGSVISTAVPLTVNVIPPTITAHPQPLAITVGATATFSVTVSGTAPFGYQWLKDGVTLAGATQSSLTLSNVQPSDSANYTVIVSNAAGSAISNSASLTVNVVPAIAAQPVAQTVVAGQPVTFTVLATGAPIPGYQWRKAGVNLPGATTASLTIAITQPADAGNYDVVVSNVAGSVTSNPVALTVNVPPAITTPLQPQTVAAGAAVTFTVVATGTPAPTYQWRKDGTNISGATGASYSIASAQPSDAATYTVVVANVAGTVSPSATLTVNVAPVITAVSAPRQLVTLGQTLALSVTATGSPEPAYQWKRNGIAVAGATASTYAISGATTFDSGYYQATATNAAGSATSAVVFVNVAINPAQVVGFGGNASGQISIPAGLTDVLAISSGDKHNLALKSDGTVVAWGDNSDGRATVPTGLANVVAVVAGEYHSLALKADGTVMAWGGNPGGQTLVPSGLANVVAVATGSSHVLALKSDGTVVAWGYNAFGQATVPAGLANVVAVAAGGHQSLALKADGTVAAWGNNVYGQATPPAGLVNVVAIASNGNHCLALRADGTVVAWGNNDNGQTTVPAGLTGVVAVAGGGSHSLALKADHTVVAWGNNSSGQAPVPVNSLGVVGIAGGGSFTLLLRSTAGDVAPAIITQPASQTVTAGQSVTFSVAASGTPAPTYQWRKGGTAVSGATNPTFSLTSAQSGDSGNYDVVVTNTAGSVISNSATLGINLAPVITTQPQPQTVTLGGSFTFSVVATGAPAPTYQWRKGGVNLAGATGSAYSVANAQTSDAGTYEVALTNVAGGVVSNPASLTVNVPPTITTQPLAQTGVAGASVSFSVLAAGTPAPTYQWRKNGVAIVGATNSFLAFASIAISDAGTFDVVVANTAGSVTSNAVTLTVNVPPVITTQPTPQSVVAGATVSFTVVATGTPAPTYQWLKNGASITGATSATLTMASVQPGDSGNYTAVVANLAGSAISNAASLSVLAIAPSIITQPSSQTVVAGSTAAFGVTVSGTAPFSYQWLKNGATLPGATQSTLGLNNVVLGDAGNYSMVVANAAGSAISNSATLTVSVLPTITSPIVITPNPVVAGGSVTFSISATGTPAPTFQWRKGGVNLAGATNASLTVASAQPGDTGSYDVVVTNFAGSVTANAVTLIINVPPAITTQPQPQTVVAGAGTTFTVVATGTPAPTYQWRRNSANLPGATGASLTIASTQPADAGNYDVVVTNIAGGVTSNPVALTVNVPPLITAQPQPQTVVAGLSATFTVVATGAPAPTYQWRKNTVNLTGGTGASFSVASAQPGDAGTYDVVVTNVAGSVASNAVVLTVNVPPAITTQPQSQTVVAGESVSLAVVATGAPAPTYQWRKGGVNINGATSDTYSLFSGQSGDAGNYDVVVTNLAGSVISNEVTLSVNVAPAISTQPSAQTVIAGAPVSLTVVATGTAPLSYQWRKGGVSVAGATTATYTLSAVQLGDAGEYNVIVTNVAGSVASGLARLTVNVAPAISTHPQAQTVMAGTSVSFGVEAIGTPPPTYQWRKGGANIAGATNPSYQIASAQAGDSGNYDVVVSNLAGSAISNAAALTVNVAPAIATQPQAQAVVVGANVSFTVGATGTPAPTYQWLKNGASITGATVATFALSNVQPADAGNYAVVVANVAGNVISNAAALTVTVIAPSITAQPQSLDLKVGATATFNVTVNGTPPFTYQWLRNGTTLAGATQGNLTLNNVQLGDSANYTVVVINSAGSAISSTATLAVTEVVQPPVITAQPQPRTVAEGGNVTFSVTASSTATLTYQWKKDGLDLTGESNATLSRTNVQLSDAAHTPGYSVRVTNAGGSVLSAAAALTITAADVAPSITSQPAAQTVALGQSATFVVVATGSPAPTFQWRKAGTDIAGATGASYTVANAQTSAAGNYDVVVTNSVGSVTSSVVTLTVIEPPVITSQPVGPASGTVISGTTVTFNVVATGAGPLTYQWYEGASGDTSRLIAGATVATYTSPALIVTPPALTATARYWVRVAGAGGSVDSTAAAVSIAGFIPDVSFAVDGPAQFVPAGGPVTLRVRVTYTGQTPSAIGATVNLPAGWSLASTGGPNIPQVAPLAGTTTVLEWGYSSFPANVAEFTFVVNAPAGQTGSKVLTGFLNYRPGNVNVLLPAVTLRPAMGFTSQPQSFQVDLGRSVTLTAAASGDPAPTYQWRKSGQNIPGATTSSLVFAALTLADAGYYDVVASNGVSPDVTSETALLRVIPTGVSVTHLVVGGGYSSLDKVTISATINYSGVSSGLGWQVLLPDGWSFASDGGVSGEQKPAVGTTGLLEWAWTTVPASPVTFTYTLNKPAGLAGEIQLVAIAVVRIESYSWPFNLLAKPDPLRLRPVAHHSADTDKNFRVSLVELTRVIELYNTRNGTTRTGRYKVQDGTEDGFAADPEATTNQVLTRYHSADTDKPYNFPAPEYKDGRISLVELTRVIELYNSRNGTVRNGQYHAVLPPLDLTEDGYAPGL